MDLVQLGANNNHRCTKFTSDGRKCVLYGYYSLVGELSPVAPKSARAIQDA